MPSRWILLASGLLLTLGARSIRDALPTLAQGDVITEFSIPTANGQPLGITWGPDGNVWFTESAVDKIGRITPDGTITEFGGLTKFANPNQIVTGPDGNLWFTESAVDKIGQITPDGKITEFGGMTQGANPFGITVGPDGNLWFTEWHQAKVGKITPDGAITEYQTPTDGSGPQGIAAMADGMLWFTESFVDQLGQVTTDGQMTEYSSQPTSPDQGQLPPGCSDPNAIISLGSVDLSADSTNSNSLQSDEQPGKPVDIPGQPRTPDDGWKKKSTDIHDENLDPGYLAPVKTMDEIQAHPCAYSNRLEIDDSNTGIVPKNPTAIPSPATPNPATVSPAQEQLLLGTLSPFDVIMRHITELQSFRLNQSPMGLSLGPDGNLWVAERGDMVARLTPDGKILQFRLATANSIPTGITAGADDNVWFTEFQSNKIGRVNLNLVPPEATEAAAAK